MKVFIAGDRTWYSLQSPRIESGFIALGYEVKREGKVDIIYSNDPSSHKEAIGYKEKNGGKLVLNILDVPYLGDLDRWKDENLQNFKYADILTCISNTVKKDIKEHLGLDANVIYNPVKDVCNLSVEKPYNSFLYAGRANDSGKRFHLVAQSLNILKKVKLQVCGSENPSVGNYLGVLSDDDLNLCMNNNQWMIYPSKFEGIGLPPIEFMLTGGFSILTNDNPTFVELHPKEILANPNPTSIVEKIVEISENESLQLFIKSLQLDYYKKFNKVQIAKNIINLL